MRGRGCAGLIKGSEVVLVSPRMDRGVRAGTRVQARLGLGQPRWSLAGQGSVHCMDSGSPLSWAAGLGEWGHNIY